MQSHQPPKSSYPAASPRRKPHKRCTGFQKGKVNHLHTALVYPFCFCFLKSYHLSFFYYCGFSVPLFWTVSAAPSAKKDGLPVLQITKPLSSMIEFTSIPLSTFSSSLVSAFISAATGSMRCVSSLCFLDKRISPLEFLISTALDKHHSKSGDYSATMRPDITYSRNRLVALFNMAQVCGISTTISSLL